MTPEFSFHDRPYRPSISWLPFAAVHLLDMKHNHSTVPQPATAFQDFPCPSRDGNLEAQLAQILSTVPPIIRLPAPGKRCRYTQLSRSAMAELIAPTRRNNRRPPVRAAYHRAHQHAQRGVWLIPAENLFRYLLALMDSSVEDYLAATAKRNAATVDDAEDATDAG